MAERIAELEREVGRLSWIEVTVAEQADEQRRRAERAEAELERLKARSWWDRLRGR
jgi:hypothetical protein